MINKTLDKLKNESYLLIYPMIEIITRSPINHNLVWISKKKTYLKFVIRDK